MPKGIRCAFVTQPCGAGRSSRNRLTSRSSSKGSTGTSNKTPTLQRFFLGTTGRRHAARARRQRLPRPAAKCCLELSGRADCEGPRRQAQVVRVQRVRNMVGRYPEGFPTELEALLDVEHTR